MSYEFVTHAIGPPNYSSVRYIWKKDGQYYLTLDCQDIEQPSNTNMYLLVQPPKENPKILQHKNKLEHIIKTIDITDVNNGHTFDNNGTKWTFNFHL